MNKFIAFIIAFLFLNGNVMAFVHFHVYVKNETGSPLVINKKSISGPTNNTFLKAFP